MWGPGAGERGFWPEGMLRGVFFLKKRGWAGPYAGSHFDKLPGNAFTKDPVVSAVPRQTGQGSWRRSRGPGG